MKSKQFGLLISIIVFTCVVVSLLTVALVKATDVSTGGSMKDLLVTLDNRVEQQPGFTFYITLANPPNDKFVAPRIGDGDDDFRISEIGADYVCLVKLAGAALPVSCITYTNISGISYLDN